jgi:hypothetical protein
MLDVLAVRPGTREVCELVMASVLAMLREMYNELAVLHQLLTAAPPPTSPPPPPAAPPASEPLSAWQSSASAAAAPSLPPPPPAGPKSVTLGYMSIPALVCSAGTATTGWDAIADTPSIGATIARQQKYGPALVTPAT